MPSAKEILRSAAAEQIDNGLVDLVTVDNYDRFVGAMLVADDSHRLMMEDLGDDLVQLWSWTPWVDGRFGETGITTDEHIAQAAVRQWLTAAPPIQREPSRDIFSVLPVDEDWR
ncbi:hypothetical protein ACFQBY_01940 [Promicromonospora citrea]|uniref:Uncharacterized protein n=1 Tax=Promicromonospora citrea TaxID=43677 RepID=A0A8H9GIA8_9MICO|nr:hypothetical protein [Promicromonospora citrea]NNH54232.1 hypothetical protein [Promicromonospora citrea]GGM21148.1 hypothetical protein GCM10010102_16100 [Promicromonospora citrea]